MIDALLEYSRIRATATMTSPTDLRDVVGVVRHELREVIEESGADLCVGELPVLDVNAILMQSLLQNLIGNALKFSAGTPRVRVEAVAGDGDVVLTVDDDGIGVPLQRRDEVFDMFCRLHGRTEFAGSGMGLALCRGIAEAHGGRIWLEDSPMSGTRVCVSLPQRKDTK